MYDATTYLLLAQREHLERSTAAQADSRALLIARLRRLDRRAHIAATRARLARLALS